MEPEPKKRLGRPPDPGKVDALLDAGWDLFLARGYATVTMEAIAAEAAVSRVTLYKYFPDKTALFAAAVQRATQRIEAEQRGREDVPDGPLRERLERFGLGLMTFLGSPTAVSFYSVLSGELRHHPEVARAFFDHGPQRSIGNLAAILVEAARRGEVEIASPEAAAEMLIGIWQGMSNYRLALALDVDLYHAGLADRVREGVELFLRGCATGWDEPPTSAAPSRPGRRARR